MTAPAETADERTQGMDFIPADHGMSQEQMRQRIREMTQLAFEYKLFGPLEYSNGSAEGYFVQFEYDEGSGALGNYTVRLGDAFVRMFDLVAVDGFLPDDFDVVGSTLKAWDESVFLIIHNNPTTLLHFTNNHTETSISFRLSEGANVENLIDQVPPGSSAVRVSTTEISGVIGAYPGTIGIEETSEGTYVNLTLGQGSAFFRIPAGMAGTSADDEEAILDSIVAARICAEVSVVVRDGDVLAVGSELQNRMRIRIEEAAQNKIMLIVGSEISSGKMMQLTCDVGTMERTRTVGIAMDGVNVRQAVTLQEMLSASGSTSEDAVFYTIAGENNTKVLVYVPHFSEHTLTIEGVESGISLEYLAVLGVVLAVAVAVTAIALMRKK
jgi:hypothetical protein